MYCKACGKEIHNDAQFCQFCGCKVDRIEVPNNNSGAEVVWKVFARIAKIVGIVSIPLAIYTWGLMAIEGLVLACLALKAKNESVRSEARTGVILNSIGIALGVLGAIALILFIVFIRVCE